MHSDLVRYNNKEPFVKQNYFKRQLSQLRRTKSTVYSLFHSLSVQLLGVKKQKTVHFIPLQVFPRQNGQVFVNLFLVIVEDLVRY